MAQLHYAHRGGGVFAVRLTIHNKNLMGQEKWEVLWYRNYVIRHTPNPTTAGSARISVKEREDRKNKGKRRAKKKGYRGTNI